MKLRRTMTTLGLAGTLFGSALGVGGSADAAASTSPQTAASATPQAAPLVWATLYITSVGNGYYLVVVDGHSTAVNTPVGIRVYGDDEWFDDFLFGAGGYSRTDEYGNFNVSATVHGNVLNEDWGRDEVYAIADAGFGIRSNTISRSF